ncbi:succinate dehydrogenase cytochrome b subunit [Flavilitoribacter nigricans]|uniref:Succinate dehydrogenase n=1 Tax=Flavilitoribacter nigricans (strain ATCC 23147 / DSM 23189 / NBRC 102662 / NCIMB 1420 / SS-2) TaxID=1122177 RepID=A0A2D0NA46_FLAN2|nr:succinate dehydrogenase cytochrome b subunit [Flavilitoribacter nigricans]PHN05355.1 succinate dehydrogenase [Flavilitoribacter nigricans DSM 23189 = NBRC 102662]
MSWFSTFLTSSVGRKLVMSLTGLFLIIFLVVHLIGNLQLLFDDGGEKFNLYAKFMTTNPVIKLTSYLLYAGILLHAIQGWLLWRSNANARETKYAVKVTRTVNTNSFASRNMGWLGTIIFIFILIHLYQFWLQMKMGVLEMVTYEDVEVDNLYYVVAQAFQNPLYVVFYVICMVVIAYHLLHGFQSAFQTLGLNHSKYSPLIRTVGRIYAVVVPLAFAFIPVYMYLQG